MAAAAAALMVSRGPRTFTACGLIALLLLLTGSANAEEDHSGHAHGGEGGEESPPWKWAGVFDLKDTSEAHYTLVASLKESGAASESADDPHAGHDHGRLLAEHKANWPKESVVALLVKTVDLSQNGIEAVEGYAEQKFVVATATPYANSVQPNVATKLVFDSDSPIAIFNVEVASSGPYVLFLQCDPKEFEGFAGHYLKDQNAVSIKPKATEPSPEAQTSNNLEHAGQAIAASLITTFIAIVGLAVVVPFIYSGRLNVSSQSMFALISGMFAAGALLATAFMFIFPETLHSLRQAYTGDSDAKQAAGLGASALAGIGASATIASLANLSTSGQSDKSSSAASGKQGVEMTTAADAKENTKESTVVTVSGQDVAETGQRLVEPFDTSKRPFFEFRPREWTAAAWVVLLGDFLHNLVDGIAIGIAFKTCDPLFGWVVATGTIAHEISQELADFMVLITRGRMSIGMALVFNLLSGISCLIGTVVALYADVSHETIGISLGFSGGVYCWVAVGECMSYAVEHSKSAKDLLIGSLFFVLGAVALGLVLLSHVHCESPAAGVDPHAGHNH